VAPKDETYIVDLCDQILCEKAERQYRGFAFLTGDTGRKLPVDAYYRGRQLVVEYHERQHTEPVSHFDKPSKPTRSGVHRGEQRRLYDERRRTVLPKHGIFLLILDYSLFRHDSRKRLCCVPEDERLIREKLASILTFEVPLCLWRR
jgi:hypothetical protein